MYVSRLDGPRLDYSCFITCMVGHSLKIYKDFLNVGVTPFLE